MVQNSAKDKSHAVSDPKAGSMHGFLCADFLALFQHPRNICFLSWSSWFVPETIPWGAVSPFLVILTKRRCFLQNWSLRNDGFTDNNQLQLVTIIYMSHEWLTFIYCWFHYFLSFWSLFCAGSEELPGAWCLLLHRTVCHVLEDLCLLLQQEQDLFILLLKLFCRGEQKTGMKTK